MAGAGYKLFNTGDVLTAAQVNTYLMEQTVMVFADAAARTTALTGVVSEGMLSYLKDTNAVEVYNGSAWVSSDDPNAIQNTIVDAKGDLITATAADTPARLAAGNNGETLVADSAATVGLRYSGGVGLTQPVINGSYDIWQRGTSFAITTPAYIADRWQAGRNANASGSTFSRQVTNDTTNLPFVQYCVRVQRDSGNSATNAMYLSQSMESVNSIPYAGKTITFSFYARKGANYSAASDALIHRFYTGTGTDQNVLTAGYTGSAQTNTTFTLTTTWQRFSVSIAIASTATEIGWFFDFAPVGTAGAADYYEVTGVQIDVGNVALPLRRSGGTIQGELAACQRYYWRSPFESTYTIIGTGSAYSTGDARIFIPLPVPMRVQPTTLDYGGTTPLSLYDGTNVASTFAGTVVTLNNGFLSSRKAAAVSIATGGSALTAFRPYFLILSGSGDSTQYIGFGAEL